MAVLIRSVHHPHLSLTSLFLLWRLVLGFIFSDLQYPYCLLQYLPLTQHHDASSCSIFASS
jgi:hypothetical protein